MRERESEREMRGSEKGGIEFGPFDEFLYKTRYVTLGILTNRSMSDNRDYYKHQMK